MALRPGAHDPSPPIALISGQGTQDPVRVVLAQSHDPALETEDIVAAHIPARGPVHGHALAMPIGIGAVPVPIAADAQPQIPAPDQDPDHERVIRNGTSHQIPTEQNTAQDRVLGLQSCEDGRPWTQRTRRS